MKILLCSPHQRKFQAQYFYIRALKSLGHSVDVFWYNQVLGRSFQPSNKLGIKLVPIINNILLRKLVRQKSPDILLYNTGADILSARTIKYIKATGCITTMFSGDSPIKLLKTSYESKYLKHFDAVFVSDEKHKKEWQSLGAKKVVNLPIFGVDPNFHKHARLSKSEKKKYSSDVCFVGSLFQDRQDSLISIIKLLPKNTDIKIWGYIYKNAPLDKFLQPFYQGLSWEKKLVKIFSSSKISLNFLPLHMGSGGNMRTFEIPACKSVQLVDKIDTSWYRVSKEVVTFTSPKDAASKIKDLLKNESKRKAIALAGHKKTIKEHTYKNVFSKYISIVSSL